MRKLKYYEITNKSTKTIKIRGKKIKMNKNEGTTTLNFGAAMKAVKRDEFIDEKDYIVTE